MENDIFRRPSVKAMFSGFVKVRLFTDGTEYKEAHSFVWPTTNPNKPPGIHYKVGEDVRVTNFDNDPYHECGIGIHVHRYMNQCDVWRGRLFKK